MNTMYPKTTTDRPAILAVNLAVVAFVALALIAFGSHAKPMSETMPAIAPIVHSTAAYQVVACGDKAFNGTYFEQRYIMHNRKTFAKDANHWMLYIFGTGWVLCDKLHDGTQMYGCTPKDKTPVAKWRTFVGIGNAPSVTVIRRYAAVTVGAGAVPKYAVHVPALGGVGGATLEP